MESFIIVNAITCYVSKYICIYIYIYFLNDIKSYIKRNNKEIYFFSDFILKINCDKFLNNCNMYPIVMNIMPHDSRGKFNFYIIDRNAHRMIATACLFAQLYIVA